MAFGDRERLAVQRESEKHPTVQQDRWDPFRFIYIKMKYLQIIYSLILISVSLFQMARFRI